MAAKDEPPLISAVLAKDIVECRRLIDTGEANVNGDRDFKKYHTVCTCSCDQGKGVSTNVTCWYDRTI